MFAWSPGPLTPCVMWGCEMERLQRHGGTAGYVSAFCLLVLLILSFGVPGTGATYADPARALAQIAGDRWLWRLSNLAGVLASGLAVVFTIGLWVRLREPAPTRATVVERYNLDPLLLQTQK